MFAEVSVEAAVVAEALEERLLDVVVAAEAPVALRAAGRLSI